MKKLSNKTKLEILVGRLVILIIESLIGCALILGFFWLLGTVLNWVEQSTFRMWAYFLIMGAIIAKMVMSEINK